MYARLAFLEDLIARGDVLSDSDRKSHSSNNLQDGIPTEDQ